MTKSNPEISRRNVLKGTTAVVAGVAGLVAIAPCAMAKPKRTQSDVAYQDHPHGKERCDNCDPFIAPNGCKTVQGTVSASGWCKIYSEA